MWIVRTVHWACQQRLRQQSSSPCSAQAIKCFLRGLLHSLPTMSRNIRLVNTAVTELGFMPRAAGGSKGPGSSNGGVAVHLDSSRGPAEPSLTEAFTPHILRLGDTAHLGFDLQS